VRCDFRRKRRKENEEVSRGKEEEKRMTTV